MNNDTLLLGLTWYVVFLLSTTCHEAAHALIAKWGGDLTAHDAGQVSLDPIPHIRREPFGMIVFPILSYLVGGWMMGWASAPYDPNWARQYPRRAAWKSLAGPGANFTLAILAGIAIHIGIALQVFVHPGSVNFTHIVEPMRQSAGAEGAATLFSILFSLNLLLGVFNLLPIPPLDGFSAAPILLTEAGGRRFLDFGMQMRRYSFLGLLIAWKIFDPLFDPVFTLALRALYPTYSYGR